MKWVIYYSIIFLIGLTATVTADELVHGFKNPSFSGIGTSAHYLTVENQEKSRRDQIKDDIESALKAAEREADNTTLAKFIRNLESRIYAQLSKQLVDNMFGTECTGECPTSGTAEVEGSTIYWVKDTTTETISLTITQPDGTTTTMSVPVGDFNF